MRRPLVLALVLALVAASLVGLVHWISSGAPESAQDGARPGAGAMVADAAAQHGARADAPAQPADLAVPAPGADARALAPEPADDTGPTVAIAGRVRAPAGCAPDATVEVLALDRAASVETALLSLFPAPQPARGRNPFGFDDDEQPIRPEGPKVLARAALAPDGSFQLDVPASRAKVHVLALGRAWYTPSSREVATADAPALELATVCGAWIAGAAELPQDASAQDVEGVAVSLETSLQALGGAAQDFPRVNRRVAIHERAFEFRALPPGGPYQLRAEPQRLAAAESTTPRVAAGEGLQVALRFLRGGTVSGHVVAPDGAPVAGARVEAQVKGAWFGFDDRAVRSGDAAADGAFALAGVPPGKLEVKAFADGWMQDKPVQVEVADGGRAEGVNVQLSRGAAVAGTLAWPDGKPAVGLEVRVTFDLAQMAGMAAFNALKGARGKVLSDAQGRFRVEGLGTGPFRVEARALSAADAEALKDAPEPQRKRAEHRAYAEGVKPGTLDLALVLRPPTGIRGVVVDTAGAPVTDFTVSVNGVGTGMLAEVGQESRSEPFQDARGEFLLSGVHDGRWKLRANAKGFAESTPVELALPLAADAEPVRVTLQRAALVRGVVRGPDGSAVAGATVQTDDGGPAWARQIQGAKPPETRSDEQGRFELGLKPGRTALVADHKEFARSLETPLDLSEGQTVEGTVLVLRAGGTLTGEVYHEGKPAPGLMVQVQDTKRFAQSFGFSDGDGRFAFRHLDPGNYQVIAMPARGDALTGLGEGVDPSAMLSNLKMTTADVTDGAETHVVLGAPPEDPVVVRGRVTLAGAPVAGASVMFLPAQKGGGLKGFKPVGTKADGAYEVTLDGPGDYSVSVQRYSPQMDAQSVNELRYAIPKVAEHVIDIALPEGRITGRVEGPDGKPLVGARVSIALEGSGRPGTVWGGQYHELRTNAAGEYDALGLDPGTYTVMAGGSALGGLLGDGSSAQGGREAKGGLRLDRGAWLRGVDFHLKLPGTAEVTVVDDRGDPVSGATVFARDEQGHAVDTFSFVTTNGSGVGRYAGLAPGRYSFRARAGDASSAESALVRVEEGAAAGVRLALEKGSRLLVRVADREGKPLVAALEVLDAEGREVGRQMGLSEIMERFQGGGFSFEEQKLGPFPPGKYRVRATLADGRSETKPVTLSGQAERKVTISFD
jgi:hypothetical protein